ncbi:endolytic transglycosylase MltG [Candidatus Kaiserbacteria bacterium CG10_big_fil_rev_8_21_14_0_10_43_70]|uniref:Endolytic murein transglycosylase n=1 Tax=Candidatus Kaiserbacteria bacterium CG10_big_fil_rev_8_21_14_0_10_43_70 TaxID=1974605 RepID=A0A2H0UJ93_9BACT|nr:MAG: endolytic transglycosylase MltG [Candidatus Kaiserbacteria bacterium CG10_big_fil_rev_8_21_14_0_10_43_70]
MNSDLTEAWERVQDMKEDARSWWHRKLNRKNLTVISLIFLPLLISYVFFIRPPSNFPTEDIYSIKRGESVTFIAQKFEDLNIVRSALALRLVIEFLEAEHEIIAGDYQFKRPLSLFSVARRISTGAFGLEPIRTRIPEGATVEDISIILSERLPRFDADLFLREAGSLEGFLFPDTYFFLPNADVNVSVRAMLDNFEQNLHKIETELSESGRNLDDIVIMASILEKEASIFEDKRKIAGVLWKRIDMGMNLQVDAPFVYFLGKNTFELTLNDLNIDSPYNTYRYKGLPPTAISNPGLDSLKAAVNPDENEYLFYLADHYGVTHYSETYEEHLQKKRLYLGT